MKLKITFISDTHEKHKGLEKSLIGGDIIIHAGDITNRGSKVATEDFISWYNTLPYDYKIFIAGNHDFLFELNPSIVEEMLEPYSGTGLIYLQDSLTEIEGLKIYGSPWQPNFHNWAFQSERGLEMEKHWNKIPENIDILVTHGPAYGFLDQVIGEYEHLGCADLTNRILQVSPKIHVCGHIHTGYGYREFHGIKFLNASLLDEQYAFAHEPINILFDTETKKVKFI